MSLPQFIQESLEEILSEWEGECVGTPAERAARRLHFGKVLRTVADEMQRIRAAETAPASAASAGVERRAGDGAAHRSRPADRRLRVAARAGRAPVARKHPSPSAQDLDDLVHFNAAMDRSLAELTATFSPSRSQPHSLFLGVLNHELRTSVASILMSAQVLTHRSAPDSPESKAAQRILRSCEQVRQALDALSDFTNVRLAAHLEIARARGDMGVLCRQALDAFARIDPERKVRLTSDGDLSGEWDAGAHSRSGPRPDRQRRPLRLARLDGDDRRRRPLGRRGHVTVHGDGTPIDFETLQTIFDPVARGRVGERDLRRPRPRPLHRPQGRRRARRPRQRRGGERQRDDVHGRAAAPRVARRRYR